MGDPSSSDGLTGGIFDAFRDDVFYPHTTRFETENDYVECHPGGRDQEGSQRIYALQHVRQIGENPLVIFELGIPVSLSLQSYTALYKNLNLLHAGNL